MSGFNAFQSGHRKVIPAVLVYARRGSSFLMIHKHAEAPAAGRDSWHTGRWNGLGGKCEADESPLESARREFREEAGVDLPLKRFRPLGVIQFPNFKPHKSEDWVVFVFTLDFPRGEFRPQCDEGDLHWVKISRLQSLPLWEGDREFLPWVAKGRPFLGTFWYRGQKLERHWLAPLSGKQPAKRR